MTATDYHRSEALAWVLQDLLDTEDDHPIIRIGALSRLLIDYLHTAPHQIRNDCIAGVIHALSQMRASDDA